MTNTGDGGSLPHGCPPEGHVAAEGRFYRLTSPKHEVGDATIDQDWRLPLHTRKSEGYKRFEMCSAYAISVFADLPTLLAAREAVAFVRRKSVAAIDLEPEMGRTLETESFASHHHDWWPTEDAVPVGTVVETAAES